MQRSRIKTIKYHTWPRTPYGKVTKKTQEKHPIQEIEAVSPFPAGDYKAARMYVFLLLVEKLKLKYI